MKRPSCQGGLAAIRRRLDGMDNDQDVSPEERMTILLEEIQKIDAQLGDKDRSHADGVRMSEIEWHTWRKSAIVAKNYKVAEYRRLKAECKKRNLEKLPRANEIPPDPLAMLGAAVRILKRVSPYLTPEELSALDHIREFLYLKPK